jgi:nitroreductase
MILDLLHKRRSRRSFLNKPVEREKLETLTRALLLSPTSRDRFPWEFIIVDDPEKIEKLSKAKEHGSSFLRGAPLAVVLAADPEKSDVWVEDCSIAAAFLQLAAEDIDLGSCWIQIRNRQHPSGISAESYVKNICAVPDGYRVDSIIAAGYPADEKPAREKGDLPRGKIHTNTFGNNVYGQ